MNIKLLAVLAVLVGFGALVCANELRLDVPETAGRLEDNIDLPFVNDPELLGNWESVDFVREPGEFKPGGKQFRDDLYLKGLTFSAKGRMTGHRCSWTSGVILDAADKTAARYTIEELNGEKYMFMEWKSGDYVIRHQKPEYYVLKKGRSGSL